MRYRDFEARAVAIDASAEGVRERRDAVSGQNNIRGNKTSGTDTPPPKVAKPTAARIRVVYA